MFNPFAKAIAFFNREDAYAKAAFLRAEAAEKRAVSAVIDAERKLREEFDAEIAVLKKQISALKGQITKLGAKRGK